MNGRADGRPEIPTTPENTPNARRTKRPKRALRRVAIVVASVLVAILVFFSALLALIDSDAVVARVKDKVMPMVSEKVGREVTLDSADARIFPSPHVTLGHLVVHGLKGEPALVESSQADVDLKLWPLIRSFGKDVEIDAITLVKPEVNLLHKQDGTWNYEGLGSKQPSSSNREVSIARLDVVGGVVRVIDRSGPAGEETVALQQLDLKLKHLGLGQALSMSGAAAFASDAQNVHVDLSTSPLQSGVLPELNGTLKLEGAELPRLSGILPAKLSEIATGGRVDADLKIATRDGRYALDGDARANALQLRGQPAHGGFHVRTTIDPKAIDAARVELTQLVLKGPGLDLGGTATASLSPRRVEFALNGPLLDLDQLLGVLPAKQDDGSEPKPVNRTAMLPANVRAQMDSVDVRGSLKIDRVVNGKLSLDGLDAQAVLNRGVLTLEKAQAKLYGGLVDASGTTAVLTSKLPRWNLQARLQQVDLHDAMTALSGMAPLEGRIDAKLNVHGEGADWDQIRTGLDGTGALAIRDGALTTTDLGAKLGGAVAEALRTTGKNTAASTVEKATGRTELKDLAASFTVRNGFLELNEPMAFTSRLGGARLDGRIGLDQTLDLRGDVVLSKDFLTSTLGHTGFAPPGPLTVPLKIGGSLKKPEITGVDTGALASQVLKGAAESPQARQVEEQVKRQARQQVGDFLRRLGGGK